MDYTPIVSKLNHSNKFFSKFKLMDENKKVVGYFKVTRIISDSSYVKDVRVMIDSNTYTPMENFEVIIKLKYNKEFEETFSDLHSIVMCCGGKVGGFIVKNNFVEKSFFRKLVELLTPTI